MSNEQRSRHIFCRKSPPSGDNMGSFTPSQPYSPLDITEDLSKLAAFEETTSKYRLPSGVKPCISDLLSRCGSIRILESWRVHCIITAELKRVAETSNQVQKRLENWGKATLQRFLRSKSQPSTKQGTSWTHPPHKMGRLSRFKEGDIEKVVNDYWADRLQTKREHFLTI